MHYFNEIQRIICLGEFIPTEQIKLLQTKTRKREIVHVRQLVMYFLREVHGEALSWAKIALKYNKDHATAMHAHQTICNLIYTDKKAAERISLYRIKIYAVIDFEKNIMADDFEITKARLKQMVDDNIPISNELRMMYNLLLEKTQITK